MPRRERLSREKRRELRELGFDPNDGYDYTRHLRLTGEGGGTIFVPTKKDHVKGVSRGEGGGEGHAQNERAGAQSAVTAGGSGKRGKDDQDVFLREDVERLGDLAQPIGVDQKPIETVAAAIEEEQRWTARARQGHHGRDDVRREGRRRRVDERHRRASAAEARSIHWSPYDRVRVVNADP